MLTESRGERPSPPVVRHAIELGIDYLDTSPLYSESERRVGLALEGGWREKIHLQTKVGTHPSRRGDFSAGGTRWSVENSLKLLQTARLDAVLIHDPADIEVPLAPGQALDEETASRSLASLAEPEVMAFDDESEVMTVEGGAELLSLA